jgi:hypothetical protein
VKFKDFASRLFYFERRRVNPRGDGDDLTDDAARAFARRLRAPLRWPVIYFAAARAKTRKRRQPS